MEKSIHFQYQSTRLHKQEPGRFEVNAEGCWHPYLWLPWREARQPSALAGATGASRCPCLTSASQPRACTSHRGTVSWLHHARPMSRPSYGRGQPSSEQMR